MVNWIDDFNTTSYPGITADAAQAHEEYQDELARHNALVWSEGVLSDEDLQVVRLRCPDCQRAGQEWNHDTETWACLNCGSDKDFVSVMW